MKRLLLFVSMWSWALAGLVNAQGHDAHWIFGMGYHMEFVDGDVVMHPRLPEYMASEGSSCISDSEGHLLFYSNTQRIWNRQHLPLWNGDSINTLDVPSFGSSITNGSLFLPWPGDTADRYFAFVVRGEEDWRLFLSRIDRELDNEYGGIEPGYKNIPLSSLEVGEQLTAIRHGNGRDWWVVTRRFSSGSITNAFVSILLTVHGMDTAVVSVQGLRASTIGELTASKNGDLLGLASYGGPSWIGLFEFDRCTGMVTWIDSMVNQHDKDRYYSIAFSETGSSMYVMSSPNGSLYQVSWPVPELSVDLIYAMDDQMGVFPNGGGQLEIGPNGKIYASFVYQLGPSPNLFPERTKYLGLVDPSQPVGIQFDTFGVLLPDTVNRTLSLPHFPNYTLGALVGSPCDSLSPPVDTSTAVVAPAPADWTVHPTVGRGTFVVRGLPMSVTVEAYDAFGRKAGAWRMDGDPLLVSGADWAAGPYWLVAVAADGRRLGTRRVLRLGE
jgi:hypothetical protein